MQWIRKHKIWSFIILIVVLAVGYLIFGGNGGSAGSEHTVVTAERGALSSTVIGSGQVSSDDEVELASEVAAVVISTPVKNGQIVTQGTLLVALDATEAEIALENAKVQLEKLKKPPEALELLQAENATEDAKENQLELTADLAAAYNEAFNALVDTYLDLPDLAIGLDDILSGSTLSDSAARLESEQAREYRNQAIDLYYKADKAIQSDLKEYRLLTRESPRGAINAMIQRGRNTGKLAADAVKALRNFVDYMAERNDNPGQVFTTEQASLATYAEETNTHLAELLTSENDIARLDDELVAAGRAIREAEEELIDLKNGADALDIKAAELEIREKEEAYQNYFIRAPFSGIAAKVNVKVGDRATIGRSAVTFITHEHLVEILLNEVDTAKVALGQQAKLTLDAIPGLELNGTVTEISTLGSVDDGVATYTIKINLETSDPRVKPGMSVEANIVTESKADVLLVPTAAISMENGKKFVKILENGNFRRQEIEAGLEGTTQTEVISGLESGEKVIIAH